MANAKKLKVTLVRSPFGRLRAHRATVKGLGLRRMHHSVVLEDTPEVRGMVRAVNYLVKCEEV